MPRIIFVTHPEVVIDPATPVPRWPLSPVGLRRASRFAESLVGRGVTAVYSSDEQKALDGARIVGERLGIPHRIDPDLGENDRSATGYVAPPEFWAIVEDFFGKPDESIRGWETARAAQARIVSAVRRLANDDPTDGSIVVVSHGGVGRLLAAHLQGVEIGREARPDHPGGGCWIELQRTPLRLTDLWRNIED